MLNLKHASSNSLYYIVSQEPLGLADRESSRSE